MVAIIYHLLPMVNTQILISACEMFELTLLKMTLAKGMKHKARSVIKEERRFNQNEKLSQTIINYSKVIRSSHLSTLEVKFKVTPSNVYNTK